MTQLLHGVLKIGSNYYTHSVALRLTEQDFNSINRRTWSSMNSVCHYRARTLESYEISCDYGWRIISPVDDPAMTSRIAVVWDYERPEHDYIGILEVNPGKRDVFTPLVTATSGSRAKIRQPGTANYQEFVPPDGFENAGLVMYSHTKYVWVNVDSRQTVTVINDVWDT